VTELRVADLYRLALPLLRCLDAESAHRATIVALRLGLGPRSQAAGDPALETRVFGLRFPNPVGLAAGFDKNAEVPDAMLALGFGFAEVGTVTPRPQGGNPKPRVFRLIEDKAVINRLGFNGEGVAAVKSRLTRRRELGAKGIVGVNLGANRDSADPAADYALGLRELGGLADYVTINVSSPNTPGLRDLQEKSRLRELVTRIETARGALNAAFSGVGAAAGIAPGPPLLLKIAPDLSAGQLEDIAEVALTSGIDGLIVSNTTVARPPGLKSPLRGETGGLSGAPLFGPSTEMLRAVFRLTRGELPLVGVGGIRSGSDAYAKIRAGASLVQLYTALVYRGPGLVAEITAELAAALRRDGFAHVSEAVGADAR
jgi:dihydroorotate dehydrogenase